MKKVFIVSILALCFAPLVHAQDCSTLTFITESLPQFTVGQPAHFDIEAVGGTPPYHFTVTGGTLPAGLHITGSGNIRGVPTEEADTTVFVELTDANGCHLTQAFAVRVSPYAG